MTIGALIARVATQDRQAFEQLYRLRRGKLTLQANALLAGDIAAAEDAVDEAFLDIWSKAGSFAASGSAEGWLRRIVRNKVVDQIRRKERCKETYLPDDIYEIPSPDQTPELCAMAQDDRVHIARALKMLPGEQQEALNLFYYAELSVHEISQQTDVPMGTVKSRLFHARKALHSQLSSVQEVAEQRLMLCA